MFQLFVDNISGAWCLGLILTKQKVYAFRKIFILRVCNFHNVHANAQGFLKADGQKIVNEKGENVLLRGIGLAGFNCILTWRI